MADDLPRLENPETGVRHAVADSVTLNSDAADLTTICGVRNEDFELSFDGEWSDYDDGLLCRKCTQRVNAGFRALIEEVLLG